MTLEKNIIPDDLYDRISGRVLYLADLKCEGALEAVTVRSQVPRGAVRGVSVPELPPDCFIIGAQDVPGVNETLMFAGQPIFADREVRWLGEPVLLVLAPDKRMARELAAQVKIDFEELPALMTFDEAIEKASPYMDWQNGFGDAEAAFAKAARVVETRVETGAQEHLYMEPQGALAVPRADGGLTVYASCQGPVIIRDGVAKTLGCAPELVNVVVPAVGGGFGGKEDPPMTICPQAAVAAWKLKRPVRLLYERGEDLLYTAKRHPSKTVMRSALDAEGNILALDAEVWMRAGGYKQSCEWILDTGMRHVTGVYKFPAVRARGRAVGTNTQLNGAFRGFGVPQVYTAIETHMCDIASALGVDSVELKRKYMIHDGDETVTNGHFDDVRGLRKCADAVTTELPRAKGTGYAFYNFGSPFSWTPELMTEKCSLKLKKDKDGVVHIISELMEMGQGLHTTHRKIAAETLGIDVERVVFDGTDTAWAPNLAITSASRGTVLFGKTVRDAAARLKPHLDEPGEYEVEESPVQPERVKFDMAKIRGDAFHTYANGAVAVAVEVDRSTGKVTVKRLSIAQDSGTPIDRRILKGQIAGGLIQGLGFALGEEFYEGRTGSLHDYVIPTFEDQPPLSVHIIDDCPYADGPFGAKCAGEITTVGVGAALLEAVSSAIGRPVRRLPVTSEQILSLLEGKEDE